MTCPACQAKADRIADLAEEIAYLKSELGEANEATDLARVKVALGVSPKAVEILDTLYRAKGRVVPTYEIRDLLNNPDGLSNAVSVYIHRLRRALGGVDMVLNDWGRGWRLAPEAIAKIDALRESRPRAVPPPAGDASAHDVSLHDATPEELRQTIALAAGLHAHRDGDGGRQVAEMLRRIADRLTGQPRRAA